MELIPIIIAGLIIWGCASVFKSNAQRKRRSDSEYWAAYDKRMEEESKQRLHAQRDRLRQFKQD